MTKGHFTVYQFMVQKFGGVVFDSYDEFKIGLQTGHATKRFIPHKTWAMLNIDTHEILGEGYLCRYGFDLIKIKQGAVSEYYRRLISSKKHCFLAYDINTLKIIESYANINNQLCKYDWQSGKQTQANNNCVFDTLPDDFKLALKSFAYKQHIFMYAIKPYGRVVEFHYPQTTLTHANSNPPFNQF